MKKQMWKKISIVLAALLILAAMPMSSLAEKESEAEVPAAASAEAEVPDEVSADTVIQEKATVSDAAPEKATSSDADEDEELPDGFVSNDIIPAEEEEVPAAEVLGLDEIPEPVVEIPAEIPEKKETVVQADILGTWTIDGVTTYRFEKDGTGALILPENEYAFSYTAEEDELTLEFSTAKIGKTVFTAAVDGDTLTLIKEEESGTAEFVLEKISD